MNIKIISASVRDGRQSHRVALYLEKYILDNHIGNASILDLKAYKFPVFEERLSNMKIISQEVKDFAEEVKSADGIIIVTPEYNGGYPASLKNIIDLLYMEWKKKPVGIVPVSDGPFAGTQVVTSLLFSLWKIGVFVTSPAFHVSNVSQHYNESGVPKDKEVTDKRANRFITEVIWAVNANQKMQQQ